MATSQLRHEMQTHLIDPQVLPSTFAFVNSDRIEHKDDAHYDTENLIQSEKNKLFELAIKIVKVRLTKVFLKWL